MRIRILALALFLALAGHFARGQTTQTLSANNQCTNPIDVTGLASLGMQMTGTWSATLQPEVAIGGSAAVNTQVTPSTSSTAQATITANGAYVASVSGYTSFLVCVTAYSSGTVTIKFQGNKNVNTSTLGGGSGSGLPAGATSPNGVPQYISETPSGGVAGTPGWTLAGVVPRPSTCAGNVDTILATDRNGYVSENDASACAVGLPQAGTAGFANNFLFELCDIGAGTATITPTASTISYTTGGAYTSGATSMALTTGQCADIFSDNTNYFALQVAGGGSSLPDITDTSGTLIHFAVGTDFTANKSCSGSNPQWFRKSASALAFCGQGDADDVQVDDTFGVRIAGSALFAVSSTTGDASAASRATMGSTTTASWNFGNSSNNADIQATLNAAALTVPDDGNTIAGGQVSFGSKWSETSAGCEASYGITSVNTGSVTTTTGASCLPANAVIDFVVYRVTTAITTAASFTVGITGTTAKFCASQGTLTLGATGTCAAQTGTAGALDGAAAAAIVVTFNATPGAGALRIIVFYHIAVAPTS